jgi:hypothetical protein
MDRRIQAKAGKELIKRPNFDLFFCRSTLHTLCHHEIPLSGLVVRGKRKMKNQIWRQGFGVGVKTGAILPPAFVLSVS